MSTMMRDKVVVITGAGGGIGREFALLMAKEGASVVVNDLGSSVGGEGHDAGPAERVVDEIKAAGGKAVASTDSVATWMSAHRIVQCALDSFGRVDAVINNAGILRDRMFHKMNEEEWSSVINVHLSGSFFVSRAAAPHFRTQGSGAYIFMTSTSGLIGNLGQANYAAAKLGMVGLMKNIAIEMGPFGVRSNCISPSAWSRMIGSIPTDTPAKLARVERMKNKMAASTIAPMAVYLCSDAAREVNGQVFHVRANEVFLYSHMRPVRSVHRGEGWTPQSLVEHGIPALRAGFTAVQQSADVYTWEPI